MARNPKQDANLKPYKKGELSSEEAKRRGKLGAVKSAEVRRAKEMPRVPLATCLTWPRRAILIRT